MFIIFMLLLTIAHPLFTHEIFKKLDRRMMHANSLVCVGLDPDLAKIPRIFIDSSSSPEEQIYAFLTDIIDITAPHACAFKLQKAFYDQFNEGHALLKNTIHYIHEYYPDIPAFVDCKIGDIDNTMRMYMNTIFEEMQADGVLINPYMGDDVFEPFLTDKNKVGIVLVQTSNPAAKVVQELILLDGRKLWEEILHLTINRWNTNKNLIVVLSATDNHDYTSMRTQIPQNMPILLAGIGSQGGNPSVMKQLLNNAGRGVFVNSSRGILYPYEHTDEQWKAKVLNAIIELKDTLNHIRKD